MNKKARIVMIDSPLAWAYYRVRQALWLRDIFCIRLVLTLAVWRLADYRPEVIPSWRDIRAVQWLRKRLSR